MSSTAHILTGYGDSTMTKKKDPRDLIKGQPLDPSKVEALAALQCTFDEIASGLDISISTLDRRRKTDPRIEDAIKRGREQGTRSLRRIQWESAEAGNVTMQIWLGKQWLGQKDKQERETTGRIEVVDKQVHEILVIERNAEEQQEFERVINKIRETAEEAGLALPEG